MSDITQFGNYFTFGDVVSNEYGVWISGTGTFDAPERDLEYAEIPGRNRALILDNGRFRNIEITYPAFISKQFDSRFDVFKAALLQYAGTYQMLSDTYHPNEFRLATFTGGIETETGPYNKAGSFDLVFDCGPQRYLNSGLVRQTFTAAGTITNPTLYAARPTIRVYGSGTVGIGSQTITIASHSWPYIDIDCEAMDARYGANNANSYVSVTGDAFPVLAPGNTSIRPGGSVTRVQIQPRWWTI